MPIYCYRCDACQHTVEEYQSIRDAALVECPACGDQTAFRRVPAPTNTDMREFVKPIEMYSVAMNTDDEIRAFKARCPEVDVSTDQADPMYGIPIARTRKQKMQALGALGFTEAK